ncbi:InlB B-repeat-containing protein [Cohnella boryungensis]|uniref:InlB B-repeat-containing protein n=1 Tax=Cohnella boryungensis TaxID=768479 RepID=A0ABV8SED3_9BACL
MFGINLRGSAFYLTLILLFTTIFGGFTAYLQPTVAYAASDFDAGTGTAEDPYQIATASQLNSVRNYLSEGNYFKLTADIDLSAYQAGFGWTSIGTPPSNLFQGKMDGNGYKITNLKMYKPSTNVGLFGHIGNKAVLSNMRLENVALTGGTYYIGSLAGTNEGTISNSSASGSVGGRDEIGGLVGFNKGTISNSSATITVNGTGYNEGGLVGTNNGTISASYATGSVNGGSSSNTVGGLVGANAITGRIENSYAAGSVSGGAPGGGLAGDNRGTINNSYAIGRVYTTAFKGGLVGEKYSTSNISNGFYDKNTTGQSDTGKGVGKTTAEMKTQSTYTSWDFTTVWGIEASRNNGYPYLQAIQKFVAYDENGATSGSVPTDNVSYWPGSIVPVSDNTGNLTKLGYTFAGWNMQADGQGTSYAANATLAIGSENVTLYAKWTGAAATYTVTFDSQGGSTVPSLTEVSAGATISEPTAPTRSGYTFDGWYKEASTTTAWNFSTDSVTGDTTLYAKWTAVPTYTVTFDSQGGSTVPSLTEVSAGATISEPTAPTKAGYTFDGWYKEVGTTNEWSFSADTVTGDTTLYAKWTAIPTYTVTFDSQGGSTVPSLTSVSAGSTISAPIAPTRSGYTFDGWYKEVGTATAWNFSTDSVTGDTTLYAKWTAVPTYTVTFDSQGGSAVSSLTEVSAGATISEPTAPTKAGYTFDGWYKEASTTTAWNFSTDTVSANTTLYAKWTAVIPVTYTVTFDSQGGSTVPSLTSVVAGSTISAPIAPTRSGYTFDGWYKEVGTATAWNFSTDSVTGDTTLYAKWKEINGGSGVIGGSTPLSDNSLVISTNGKLTLPAGKAGEVSLENAVSISIPANATDKELKLSINKLLDTQGLVTEQDVLASGVYEILKNFSENFNNPVTLTFTFDPASLMSGQKPSLFYYDEVEEKWAEIGGEVRGNKITATVNYFSKFAVFGVSQQTKPNGTTNFSDIVGHWAEVNIKQAVSASIVNGYPDGSFKPNRTVTRAEFAVMLMNTLKLQGDGAILKFTDYGTITAWAQKAVALAVKAQVINGYADGTFRPDAEITRSEMALMVARALGQSASVIAATSFMDDRDIPAWAKGAAGALKKLGIMEGKGRNICSTLWFSNG